MALDEGKGKDCTGKVGRESAPGGRSFDRLDIDCHQIALLRRSGRAGWSRGTVPLLRSPSTKREQRVWEEPILAHHMLVPVREMRDGAKTRPDGVNETKWKTL